MTSCYECDMCGDTIYTERGILIDPPKAQFIINEGLFGGGGYEIKRDYCEECAKKVIKMIKEFDKHD